MCAYNEEKVIAAKVENLLALRRATPWPVEILIYVDGASDRTGEILRPYADQIRLVSANERHGKTAGMNRLVAMTDAEIVVFSDANVMVKSDALIRLAAHFSNPVVGCVCGNLDYVNEKDSATAAVGTSYWRHEEELKQLESDTGAVIGADGSLFAIRRSLHRPPPADIIDDFYVSLAILCQGHRVVRGGDVLAYESATTRSLDEFRRKIRISCQAMNVHRLMWPTIKGLHWTIRYKYLSHKWLRWLSLINLAASFALFEAAAWNWLGWPPAIIPAGAAVLALGLVLLGPGPLARPREILLALAATTLGVLRSIKGERFQTWEPPASRDLRTTDS